MAKNQTELTRAQQKEYKKAVARINKQLYRLETEGVERYGKAILGYAYKTAQRDIQSFFGEGKKTYSKAIPEKLADYRKIMSSIRQFYKKPTSTRAGIQRIYTKRASSLTELMGVEVTWKQLADIFESGLYDDLERKKYGSDTILQMIGSVEAERDALVKQMEAGQKLALSGDNEKINRILESGDIDGILERYLRGAT